MTFNVSILVMSKLRQDAFLKKFIQELSPEIVMTSIYTENQSK